VRLLRELGYRNLSHFGGGLSQWRHAGLPMESGQERTLAPERREELSMHPPGP
jgi:3-mercaptopyruvate sulfurtransferase SseA